MSDLLIIARALGSIPVAANSTCYGFSADDLLAFERRLERLRSKRLVRIVPTQPNATSPHPSL